MTVEFEKGVVQCPLHASTDGMFMPDADDHIQFFGCWKSLVEVKLVRKTRLGSISIVSRNHNGQFCYRKTCFL